MKHISYFIILITCICNTSCYKSNEEKIAELVHDATKRTLYYKNSYEDVEIIIDSAFAPYDSPEFFNKTYEVSKMLKSLETLSVTMSLLEDRNDEYDEMVAKCNMLSEKTMNLFEELIIESQSTPKFIGYKVYHKYMATSMNETPIFGEYIFIVDKNIESITTLCDMGNALEIEKFNDVIELYGELRSFR